MRTFDLKDLRCFMEAAALGGVTRAAKRLHTTQSAISRRLHNLEEDLGLTIFVREPNGVRLTPAGRRLQKLAGPLLANADRVWDALASEKQAMARRINLGMVPGVSQVIHSAMKRFGRDHRDINLNVKEGSSEHLHSLVHSGDLDLAVVTNPRRAKGLKLTPLWREALYIAGPASRARGGKLQIRDLKDLPFIVATRSPGFREVLKELFEQAGVDFKVAFEIESIATVRRMIAQGDAYSVLAYPTVASEIDSHAIALHRLPKAYITRTLIRKANGARSPIMRTFIRALDEEADAIIRSEDWAFTIR